MDTLSSVGKLLGVLCVGNTPSQHTHTSLSMLELSPGILKDVVPKAVTSLFCYSCCRQWKEQAL